MLPSFDDTPSRKAKIVPDVAGELVAIPTSTMKVLSAESVLTITFLL